MTLWTVPSPKFGGKKGTENETFASRSSALKSASLLRERPQAASLL